MFTLLNWWLVMACSNCAYASFVYIIFDRVWCWSMSEMRSGTPSTILFMIPCPLKISDVIHYIFWILQPWLLRKLYALCVTGCLLNFVILEFCYIRRAESINLINFDSSEVQPLCELNQGHHESTVSKVFMKKNFVFNWYSWIHLSTRTHTPVYSKLSVLNLSTQDFLYFILEFWFIQKFIWMWNKSISHFIYFEASTRATEVGNSQTLV